jgi:hypothetical protein
MAGNNFNIPTFDIDLLNWSNNVKAQNAARARERQQDWNRVYDTAAALGKQIRAEEEAEKARKEAAEQASIQRQFQAQEAEKARAFQAAQNAANRQAQEANANAMLNKSKLDNLSKAQGEIGVLNAELEKELGTTTNPNDQALARNLHAAKVAQVYSRYGLDNPGGTPVPFKPVANEAPQVEVPQATETPVNVGLTNKQQAEVDKELADSMKAEMERIKQMKNGAARQQAMRAYNEQSNGAFGGYTPEDIKKAGYIAPAYSKGQILKSETQANDAKAKGFKVAYNPVTDTYEVIGTK